MITLLLLLVFLISAAAIWFQGMWSGIVTLINLLIAGVVALNYFELLASQLERNVASYTYLLDFFCLWGIFALTFGGLRLITDMLSRHRVVFHFWMEMVGRSLIALWVAWLMVGLVEVSLHTAPLPPHPMGFQQTPQSGNFLGFSPGRQWLALMQSRSRGALSRSVSSSDSPYDADRGMRVFDPTSQFIIKYYQRRVKFEGEPGYVR